MFSFKSLHITLCTTIVLVYIECRRFNLHCHKLTTPRTRLVYFPLKSHSLNYGDLCRYLLQPLTAQEALSSWVLSPWLTNVVSKVREKWNTENFVKDGVIVSWFLRKSNQCKWKRVDILVICKVK